MVIRIWHLFDLASMIKRAPPHTTWPSIGPRRIGSPSIFFNSARISAWRGTRGLWGWPWIWWLWPCLVNDDDDYESPLRRRCPPGWGRAGHQVQAPQLPAAWQEHLQSYKSNKKILPVAILKETSWWQLEKNYLSAWPIHLRCSLQWSPSLQIKPRPWWNIDTLIVIPTVIIIITRPKPPYGRQGLAGLWARIQSGGYILGRSQRLTSRLRRSARIG